MNIKFRFFGTKCASLISIFFMMILSWSYSAAGPISYLFFDLENTLLQAEQDYKIQNGQKIPLLESVAGEWQDSSGRIRTFKYYLKPNAVPLIQTALALYQKGQLKRAPLILTKLPQTQVNAILSAIQIQGNRLIDLVSAAYGDEAIIQYSRITQPANESLGLKDLGIATNEANISIWPQLKAGRIESIKNLQPGKVSGPMTGVILDDNPDEVVARQKENVVQPLRPAVKDENFWKKYEYYSSHPMDSADDVFKAQSFLNSLDIERNQLQIFQWLLEDTKLTTQPNVYRDWSSLLAAGKSLAVDYGLYHFLLPDLLRMDDPRLDILVLGRDADLYWTALNTLKKDLGVQSRLYYLEISRLVVKNHSSELSQALQATGIDTQSITSGQRNLLIVDTDFNGSIPAAIIRSLVQASDPEWKKKASHIRSFLFDPSRTNSKSIFDFSSLEEYLQSGAFLEKPLHQARLGVDKLRTLVRYLNTVRPKMHVRPDSLDTYGSVISHDSHPTEYRLSRILHQLTRMHFMNPEVIQQVKNRTQFMKNEKGNYPAQWALTEPERVNNKYTERVASKSTQLAVAEPYVYTEQHALEVISSLGLEHYQQDFIPHRRLPGKESEVEWFQFSPDFAKTEEIDLGKNFLTPPPFVTNQNSFTGVMPLTFDDFARIRENALLKMSRTAQGKNGNQAKVLLKVDQELAQATIAAERKVSMSLWSSRSYQFKSSAELASFIVEKINLPYVAEVFSLEEGESAQWRSWAYQNEEQKRTGDFFARHSPQDIEADWIWFQDWLFKNLKTNYDPVDLSARIHYYLSNRIHPFADGVGKTTRALMDYVFVRKGLRPIDWSQIPFEEYWKSSGSLEQTRNLILRIQTNSNFYSFRVRSCEGIFK